MVRSSGHTNLTTRRNGKGEMMGNRLSEDRQKQLKKDLESQMAEEGTINWLGTAHRQGMVRNTVKVWGGRWGYRPKSSPESTGLGDHQGDLIGYVREVRQEVPEMPLEALEAYIMNRTEEEHTGAEYAALESKWRKTTPMPWIVVQRTWLGRKGAYPLFVAEHCPELVEAYDAWCGEEAGLYQTLTDASGRPWPMTPDRITLLKAVVESYNHTRERLLEVIDKLFEAEKLPGVCSFCPDHVA